MIKLMEVSSENRVLLWNMLQGYLQEMCAYYEIAQDANGCYLYKYFDAYFSDPDRKALLINSDYRIAGFALINTHSYIGASPDYVLAEFCILPEYRKQHIGSQAAACILETFNGCWELKYHNSNSAAAGLWKCVTEGYAPRRYRLEDESVLSFRTN